jgi:CHASE2 domain-containing sensor protein
MAKLKTSDKRKKAGGEKQKGRWWVRPLRLITSIMFILVMVSVLSRLGVLHKLETLIHDTKMRSNDPPAESDVAVVRITDEDYQKIFGGKSPLNPVELQSLINAIAKGKPKVIGVDIVTTDKQFQDIQIADWWPPIIWYREAVEIPRQEWPANATGNEQGPVEPLSVLGGKGPEFDANSGLPLLIEDAEDKVTRRYRRMIETTEGLFPSFPWAVVRKFPTDKTRELKESTDDLFIRYSMDRDGTHRFTQTASGARKLAEGGLPPDNPFKDKIVLLGGSYLGQDKHDTPLGRMSGVDILAQVIETELQGGGDKALNRSTTRTLAIFEAVIVVVLFQLFQHFRFFKALGLNLLALSITALVCSYFAFGSLWRVTYFLPLLLLVLIYEFGVEYYSHLIKHLFVRKAPRQAQ